MIRARWTHLGLLAGLLVVLPGSACLDTSDDDLSASSAGVERGPDGAGGTGVTLCHIPPGNPDNLHTITVSQSAVQSHLYHHGDLLGSCDTHCEELCDDGNERTVDACGQPTGCHNPGDDSLCGDEMDNDDDGLVDCDDPDCADVASCPAAACACWSETDLDFLIDEGCLNHQEGDGVTFDRLENFTLTNEYAEARDDLASGHSCALSGVPGGISMLLTLEEYESCLDSLFAFAAANDLSECE